MSTESPDSGDYIGVCRYCGAPIYQPGQACAALEAGVCKI
jgi:hypothetical protein